MAGRKARHAASTRNTTCLASATQTSNPPKTTMSSRKKPVPCGSNTRFSSPASGVRDGPPHRGQAAPPHNHMITTANVRSVTVSSPGMLCTAGREGGHVEPAAIDERWRWDLNPRRGCPLTRFRGVRPRPLGDSTAGELTRIRACLPQDEAGPDLLARPARREEVAEQGPALLGEHPADDLRAVVQPGIPQHVPQRP